MRTEPMEKLTMPYDKEYMRIAMLKHEETFKEQLYELHRLYRVQKMLMEDIEKSKCNELSQREWIFKTSIGLTQNADHNKGKQNKRQFKFDLEQPAEEHVTESDDDDRVLEIVDETEIELTLGPSSYYNRMKKLETPRTSDSAHSLSSSSTGSSHMNKTSSRTHHFIEATKGELSGGILRLVQVPDSKSICQRGIRNSFDVEEQSRQEKLKQSPWLFQALSLNMT